jgi:carbon-monoxide dehydrogenase small subunit
MILSVRDLLARNPRPSVEQIKEGIEGNFCRCTGYQQVVEAVLDVTGQLGGDGAAKGEMTYV